MPRRRPLIFTDPNDSRFASSALLSVFFGLAAGAVGMLLAFAYGDLPVGQQAPISSPVSSALRPSVEYPALPARDISRSVVRLYTAGDRVTGDFGTFHLAPGALGAGIVLTTDGWIISHERALLTEDGRAAAPQTVVVGDRSFGIEQVVRDGYSGAVFIKVDAADLPVTPFGRDVGLFSGDQLFGLDVGGGVQRLEVLGTDTAPERTAADIVRSSERMQRFPRLSPAAGLLPGTILTDGKGDVVAVYGGDGPYGGTAVPIGAFLRQVSSVLRDGEVSRPFLGVRYIDLSRAVDAPDGRDAGALVSPGLDGRSSAITAGSPAAFAGLRSGDVIIAVNGERVSRSNPLPELIAEYSPGETVTLSVDRNTRAISVEVTLGDTAE